jgi:hypothetical protein
MRDHIWVNYAGQRESRVASLGAACKSESCQNLALLNHTSLDLIEADFVVPAIVELRPARRGVVRHHRGFSESAAVLEVSGDPGCQAAVVPELWGDAGHSGAPAIIA